MIFIFYVGFNIWWPCGFSDDYNFLLFLKHLCDMYFKYFYDLHSSEIETYIEAFTSLKQVLLNENREIIFEKAMSDFESGFNTCCKNSFPPSQDGC
ncbi:unnamed protein product [Brachionus calyciflorus]|uniref:Uncharacterized protein n=1 Tax=Brachionus calyciflorus TaxID=104777 RepID=A0A814ITG2_9BILA|nr:unnamed protein product [Brachionus calyciflorus]